MKLFSLMYGRSKNNLRCIMTDSLHKCEIYKKQREQTKHSECSRGWHIIVPAEEGSTTWRQKSATVGGNRCEVPRVGHGPSGYIGKNGFNQHT